MRAGQVLVTVYGRDYTTPQRTFLYALRAADNPPPTFVGQPQDPNVLSLEESRQNLRSMGFDVAQIARLERSREVSLDVTPHGAGRRHHYQPKYLSAAAFRLWSRAVSHRRSDSRVGECRRCRSG